MLDAFMCVQVPYMKWLVITDHVIVRYNQNCSSELSKSGWGDR